MTANLDQVVPSHLRRGGVIDCDGEGKPKRRRSSRERDFPLDSVVQADALDLDLLEKLAHFDVECVLVHHGLAVPRR
jgi:hypothetical protein